MVHSLFHPYKEVKEDLVVIYSDIIFDKNILKELIIKKEQPCLLNQIGMNIGV